MKVDRKYEVSARNASSHSELAEVLQHAFKLEHSTILPYMTAMYSLKKDANTEIAQQIREVANEEMLHMNIVANLITALGSTPRVIGDDMIPKFPGPLPMGVDGDLTVSCTKYSIDQVQNCFMAIEEPEDPIDIDTDDVPDTTSHSTIGRIYQHVRAKLVELGGPLPGPVNHQLAKMRPFKEDDLFAIKTIDDAVRAIDVIVRQGEGTTAKPTNPDGGIAHYYRFQELVVGRRLVKDDSAPEGYSFTGNPIAFDPDGVWNIAPDTRIDDLPDGSHARKKAEEFAHFYGEMMRGLHFNYNGHPHFFMYSLEKMMRLQSVGEELCSIPYPGRDGVHVGPTWEIR